MALASSSSAPMRAVARAARRPAAALSRTFAAPAYAEPEPEQHHAHEYPSYASSSSASSSSSSSSRTTPESAQAYLADLLSLPPSRAFPGPLALQMLTHKSYRTVHRLRQSPASSYPPSSAATTPSEAELVRGLASHNARLGFLGRRALGSYFAMFVHAAAVRGVLVGGAGDAAGAAGTGSREAAGVPPSGPSVSGQEWAAFLGDRDLEGKMDALRHVQNLGRDVGDAWRVGDVLRWDENKNGRDNSHARVKGLAVEAIVGGVFTHLGSAAAHRAFHLHVLPHIARQMREPALMEEVERLRVDAGREYDGGIVGA